MANNVSGFPLYPERFLAEILHAVESEKFPVLSPKEAAQSHYYKTFGLEIDGLPEVVYNDFLHVFATWYVANRNTLVLEQDPDDPFSRTWEQTDEIIESNPRLKNYVAVAPCPRQAEAPAPPPPVVPKAPTAEESAARTLAEITSAGHNRIRGLQSF